MTQADRRQNHKAPDLTKAVYRRIEQDLRDRIKSRHWQPGVMIPSRKDLAKEYGVDVGTIQRAVASLLGDGTLRADGGRGTFVPSAASDAGQAEPARPLTTSKLIALIFDQSFNPTDPGAQAIPRAIYHKMLAEEADCRLISFDTHGESLEQIVALERRALDAVESEKMAGVILWHSGGEHTLPQIQRLLDLGIPIIFMDRYPDMLDCDFVGVDDENSARDAAHYLLSLGHRRIAFLAPEENITTIEQRRRGYEKALNSAGIAPAPELICRLPYTLSLNMISLNQQLRLAAESLTALTDPPTAVFAVNDFLAHQYIAAMNEMGISVPEEVSIMGFDDIDRYSPRPPFLTSVHQPFESMGERAAELLLHRLQISPRLQRTFQHVLLPTKIVIRSSCAPRKAPRKT